VLDHRLISIQKKILRPCACWLSERGFTADALTGFGFAAGLAAALSVATHYYGAGLALIVLNRFLDGLDGAVARENGPTDRGAFLDIVLDFFFYAAVPFGFAVADPTSNALPASALLVSFIGTGSSFLAFAAIAAKRGLSSTAFPSKGIYYLGGLTEGAETISLFIAMCLWPGLFPLLAWSFAALALITTALRWWWGWRSFSE
jgi:phosphatidylglycerophosphate synthase